VDELTEVLNNKAKELVDMMDAHKEALGEASMAKADTLAAAATTHEK
jgi:hypothetical protein